MERYFSTGQCPQRAVAPMEEEVAALVLLQKKFEKLVHLVGFTIEIYHNARHFVKLVINKNRSGKAVLLRCAVSQNGK